MEKLKVVVEYIHHSCFTVEIGEKFLVFDYYKGDIELKGKDIYVFASHSHEDHFNPKILDWMKDYKRINYILSKDIDVKDEENIFLMGAYKEKILDGMEIKTFGSTDQGVSFLVSVDGINIFHAGDLNWWYWDDDPEDEKIDMENSFKIKIKRIKESDMDVDISFLPVDPRLKDFSHLGGEYFIKEIKPKYFFPMHFWGRYGTIQEFANKVDSPYTKIVNISHRNQIFEL